MSEQDFMVQCDHCGLLYSKREVLCPECGRPHAPTLELYHEPPYYYDEEEPYREERRHRPRDMNRAYREPAWEDYAGGEYLDSDYESYLDEGRYVGTEYPSGGFAGEAIYGYEGQYDAYPEPEIQKAATSKPRRFTWLRSLLGCLGVFICMGLVYSAIGAVAAYHGLQEHVSATQLEAEEHYRRGQEHLANEAFELAIAEFDLALSLNPNYLDARAALREAQRHLQSQPTPTSQARVVAAVSLYSEALAQVKQENWAQAIAQLSELRELDPYYEPEQVSELLYTANYELGLALISPDQINDALLAFEHALAERPDDPKAAAEKAKATLYIAGKTAEAKGDQQKAIEAFGQLYREDDGYLDVKERLFIAYRAYGDELADEGLWCRAQKQYTAASQVRTDNTLKAKLQESTQECEAMLAQGGAEPPPAVGQVTPPGGGAPDSPPAGTTTVSATTTTTETAATTVVAAPPPAGGGGPVVVYSAYNPSEKQWEIRAVPVGGGPARMLVPHGTMPTVSPDGRLLVYRSDRIEAEGLHRFDLTTGQDTRLTLHGWHYLPRFGGDNNLFLLAAQEPATQRWLIYQGFADGKSEPGAIRDGRTPALSPNGDKIAYQGVNPEGNDPGIYVIPFGGGEPVRLTHHESDRAPDFAPNGSQLAYMSTQNGTWDIYTVGVAGGTPTQVTSGGGSEGLPAWSPDGSRIAFVSDAGGSWGIYVVSAGGGQPTKIGPWDGANLPNWLEAQIGWMR